ncbi:MAG: SPOR domain-containing protein, partial [Bradyrhizobium sp.]
MADRYQDRNFSADTASKAESDPLAELARLIGQTDPFGAANKPPPRPLQSRANARPQQYEPQAEEDDTPPAGPPPWMQRARQEAAAPPPVQHTEYEEPEQDYQPKPVHPLHRYAAQQAQPPAPAPVAAYRPVEPPRQPEAFDEEPQYQSGDQGHDPSRYDDALYGQLEAGEQDLQRDPSYPDDPYAYEAYEEEPEPRKRRSGLMTVAAVVALAVVGTGGALAYRNYVGSPRTGEPPIIKADNSPTKVIPAQA